MANSSDRGSVWTWWMGGLLVAMALSVPVVRVLHGALSPGDMAAGWALAAANALAMLLINRRALAQGRERFMLWGVVVNALRLALLAAIVIAYAVVRPGGTLPFAMTVVTGALVFVGVEVICLWRERVPG